MKKLFISLVALIVATMSYAQSSVLATLSHNGEISTYYGATALKEAHSAAQHGDVITLSSGSFQAVNITKAVTIRGAGMEMNANLQMEPTVISGDFSIQIPTTVTKRLTIEGIYSNHTIMYSGTLKNATFLKSRFNNIYYNSSGGELPNATFIHCKISGSLQLGDNSSASCINCVIVNPRCWSDTTSNFECVNCVIDNGTSWYGFCSSSLKNCILIATQEYSIPSSTSVFYCVCISDSYVTGIFANVPNNTNWTRNRGWENQFFESGNCEYNDNEAYELSEERQNTYVGTDGTQIGIHGGNMPFSPTPTNPQITKCNVAAKSTADGKLSVDIEVNGVE